MNYTIDRIIEGADFKGVVDRTRKALSGHGFGVLTEIDVKTTLKNKINVDIDDYLILGACNPGMAHRAMEIEPKVGAMLPCNVVVRTVGDGAVEVSAIDPLASMEAIDNARLKSVAGEVRKMLETVVADI